MTDKIVVLLLNAYKNVHTSNLYEVQLALSGALKRLGHGGDIVTDIVPGARHIVLHAQNKPAGMIFPPDTIIYNFEQPTNPDFAKYVRNWGALEVWDYAASHIKALALRGIKAKCIPIGYTPELERMRQIDESGKTLDVSFFGYVNPRRYKVLKELQGYCAMDGSDNMYGDARDMRIARSKIVLNMHAYEPATFEAVRVSYLLANQCFVVSEDSGTDQHYEGGLVYTPYDQLVETCLNYLQTPSVRDTIAERGYNIFKAQPWEPILEVALRGDK